MNGTPAPPLPPVTPDTEAWWEATRERRLLVQRCLACSHLQHYPRMLCTACGSTALTLVEVAGDATVYSFTVVHRAPDPGFEAPYVVALVRLAEGPQLLTRIVGPDAFTVRCDDPVTVDWQALPDGRHLPVFIPAGRE